MPSHAEHLAARSGAGGATGWLDAHVRTIMRAGVVSVPSDTSVRQVQRALVAHGIHAVLVVDVRSGEPLGWATPRSVLEHVLGDASLTPATVAIGAPAESIAPSATAGEALQLMIESGARLLLVRRHPGSPPEGVLSEMDLVELATPSP
jgi:CBS domain containing-hemolysin-like protein